MAIRYFSNIESYEPSDPLDRLIFSTPYIRETVQAFNDDRGDESRALNRRIDAKVAYMQAFHTPSTESVNFTPLGQPISPYTTEFFTHKPASTMIDLAFSDPSLRHTMPTIGAYFANKYGNLTASGNLSQHSSKLTRNAIAKGLPITTSASNPDANVTNQHDLDPRIAELPHNWPQIPEINMSHGVKGREIPGYEIKEAKNYLREALGHKKPLSNQFDDHVEPYQYRMFMQARELMDLPAGDDGLRQSLNQNTALQNRKREENKSPARFGRSADPLGPDVKKQGVVNPVSLYYRPDPPHSHTAPQLDDGHHRVVAAYDANPDSWIPVQYH